MKSLKQTYIETYGPLLNKFVRLIDQLQTNNMPEPHLPVIGLNYENADHKVLFMGWETRGAKGLKEFINVAKLNPELALFWRKEDFDSFDFINWRNNFGKDFWSFNLKFLSKLYNIPDWKSFYKEPSSYEKILGGFAWANCNSLERYEVTAKKQGVHYDDWLKISEASKIFDNPPLLFNTLKPNIIVLMHWNQDKEKLFEGLFIETQTKIALDYLWYYKIKDPNTHLFWIKHPQRLNFERVSFEYVINIIVETYFKNS